ncbi:hypothetical protein BGZ60DRAFT_522989 [Tricladium varicosporioides]|nr:hypothetical protein BGZ60DRAFT_522989 [Hymenoscyphus varicosporioides]
MEPITEDQELTLRRWVTAKGNGPPEESDKAFLVMEKGLSREQIDFWFQKNISSNYSGSIGTFPTQHGSQSSNVQTPGSACLPLKVSDHTQNPSFVLNMEFGHVEMDLDYPSSSQETHAWSPAGLSREDDFSTMPFTFSDLQDVDAWSTMADSERGLLASRAASITESCPILSPSSDHPLHAHRSGRSSFASSVRTWNTAASTLVSIYDPKTDDMILENTNTEVLLTVNPSELTKRPICPVSRFSTCKSVPEEKAYLGESSTSIHKSSKPEILPGKVREYLDAMGPPPVPPKPIKTTWTCTHCCLSFNRKGDWKRHEESHDAQTSWVCMLGDPAVQVTKGWMCVFCNTIKPNRNDITVHLVKRHKIGECTNKPHNNRKWTRKDKLKQHLQQVHKLADGVDRWEAWHRDVRKKWAWGCGFCGACLFSWEGRLTHIADHYEKQNVDPKQWSHSLVVKGLLKQVYYDFNILEAWVALGSGLLVEESLEWSEVDAETLKRKLEYHEGAPEDLAREARALSSSNQKAEDLIWTKADSRVATLTSPLDLSEMEKGPWSEKENAVMTLRTRSSPRVPFSYSSFCTAGDEANFI